MGCDKMVSEHFDPRQQMVWSDSVGWYTPARIPNPCRSLAAHRPSSLSGYGGGPYRCMAKADRPSSYSGYGGGPYRQEMGVIGLGSSACKIPSRFQSESALEPYLPRQIPDSSDLRRRRGPAELALAVSGPDRREVKVPHSTPGKIPNPSSDLGMMKEWVVSYEEDAFDSSAVWRIASVTNYKANYKLGNLEMARSAEDLRRITLKGTQEKQCMGVPEGPEGNFNPPSTGYSIVPSGWGQNQLPLACLVSPKLNQLNPTHGPELERECPQYPRELRNQSQLQYQDIQWNLNSGNGSEAEEMGDGPGEYLVIVREPEEDNSKMFEAEGETKKENAEEKKGVNESRDDDKINKDDAGETIVHHNLYPPLINCLTEGDEVISAIGNPFGFDHILTAGVISGLNRDIFSKAGVTIENGAHFHMKLGTLLHNLEAQTLPKSLHCNFIRLTLEYFKYSSLDAYEISACKMNRTLVSRMWILDQLPEERTILVKLLYFCKYCADNEAINIWNKNHLKVEMGNVSSKHFVLALMVKDRGKGSHSDLKDINHSYLWEAWKKKYPESASDNSDKLLSLRIILLELPQQDNLFDCGLFLLRYVELFLMDTPSSFNPLDVRSCTPEDAEDSMISSAVSEKATEIIEDPGLVGMSQIDSTTALSNTRTQVGGFSVGQVQKAEPLFSGAYEGSVTALALDSMRNYSGSWYMTVCIWGRAQMKFVQKFRHADLGWPLASHGNTVTSTAGRDAYLWDSGSGELTSLISNAYVGNTYSLAQTHLPDVLFTRGEDGAIRLFGVWDVFDGEDINPAATWVPHTSPVHSLAFEYPWLVSAYCDGRFSLIELWKLLTPKSSSKHQFRVKSFGSSAIEPSHRTLHGFGCSFFSIDIGADGIEFGGENFFDPIPKKWTTKNTGPATCKGSFVQFYYEPIKLILKTCMTDQKDKLWSILRKLGVTLKTDEKELIGKALMKHVMQTWLPANNALLEMMMFYLSYPLKAQKNRVENLFEGSLDDIYATAIKHWDPGGYLMLDVPRMIPASDKGRFYAFGCVFSEKFAIGMKGCIMGSNYVPGQKKDLYEKNVHHTGIRMGKKHKSVEDVPCGNTVVMVGLDQFIIKNATLIKVKDFDNYNSLEELDNTGERELAAVIHTEFLYEKFNIRVSGKDALVMTSETGSVKESIAYSPRRILYVLSRKLMLAK